MSAAYHFANVHLLTPDGVVGGALRVDAGSIAAIDQPPRPGDLVVDGGGGLLIPGLINAHDHLEFNSIRRLKFRDSYNHSTEWFTDIEARMDSDPDIAAHRRLPLPDRLLIGGLKNLLSGVTTVAHHNELYRPLQQAAFPVRVVQDYTFAHSIFLDDHRASFRSARSDRPWIIHLAEGTDEQAAREFDTLSREGMIQPHTLLVHGIGLTASQRHELAERQGGLIWCPGSNAFLFGTTAQVGDLAAAGKLALGTDSRLTGEIDLLAELRAAAATDQLDSRQLFAAVTRDAASLLRLSDRGQLANGRVADIVLLPPPRPDPFSTLLRLERKQIELVMIAGRPRLGALRFAELFRHSNEKVSDCRVDGEERLLAEPLARRHRRNSVQEAGLET